VTLLLVAIIAGGIGIIVAGLIVWMVVGVKQAVNRNDNER